MNPEIEELFNEIGEEADNAMRAFNITMPTEQLHAKMTEYLQSILATAGKIQRLLA